MKPAPFRYHAPTTLDEAVAMLAAVAPDDGRVLAGGQSLVPIMAFRLARPTHLVDINGVAELRRMAIVEDKLTIGACVRHAAFYRQACEGPLGRLLASVVRHIGHHPIRTRGTFCGSLAHADPASEWCLVAATLDAEPVDICDIARQAADVAQQLAEQRGTKIEFRLPAEPCIAEVDSRRVERILRNLLVNAVEHGENREVVMTVAADSGAVAVSVRDFGVGLRPGEAQLVFDRFWRADPARARTTGGTGLGLAIVRHVAQAHQGEVSVESEEGNGSTFTLKLPLAAASRTVRRTRRSASDS